MTAVSQTAPSPKGARPWGSLRRRSARPWAQAWEDVSRMISVGPKAVAQNWYPNVTLVILSRTQKDADPFWLSSEFGDPFPQKSGGTRGRNPLVAKKGVLYSCQQKQELAQTQGFRVEANRLF